MKKLAPFLVDLVIGALFAALLVVPPYLAYLRGYSDGDHDRARWLHEHGAAREHDEGDVRERLEVEHRRHDDWLNHECDARIAHTIRMYELRLPDAGARRR